MLEGSSKSAAIEALKIALIVILACGSFLLTVWYHYVQKTEVLFQSIFYIPIVLTCLWWGRRGVPLAVFFALLIVVLSAVSPADTPIWENVVRGTAFIFTGVVVGELSSRRRKLIGTLGESVAERTAELEARNEELDAFASTVSHDLVGPLATLQGYVTVARDAASSGDTGLEMEGLDTADRLSRRMVETVETLLQRARDGGHGVAVERISAAEVAHEVIEDLEGILKGGSVEVVVDEGMPEVTVERVRLKQVLSNLIGNAVKHAGRGRSLRIEIGGHAAGAAAVLFVRDNGPGIKVDLQAGIFEEFERAGVGDDVPGLGLGLSIAKRAVEGWGGRIWLESAPNQGTTFYFVVGSRSGVRPRKSGSDPENREPLNRPGFAGDPVA